MPGSPTCIRFQAAFQCADCDLTDDIVQMASPAADLCKLLEPACRQRKNIMHLLQGVMTVYPVRVAQ